MADDLDLTAFQPLNGKKPWNLLDRHPDSQHVALQADGGSDLTAGVWDRSTRALVWAPDGAVAICWARDGGQVVVLWEHYQYDPALHTIIGSPLQREFTYYLERMTWPGKERVSICKVRPPSGELAAYSYDEQDCSGIELVALSEEGDRQLSRGGYQTDIGIS
jgi:hypothetical protein